MVAPETDLGGVQVLSERIRSAVETTPVSYNAGLLLLRLVVGLGMAAHGSQKLFGWFGGGGIDGTGQFFAMSGYPSGKTMAVVAVAWRG